MEKLFTGGVLAAALLLSMLATLSPDAAIIGLVLVLGIVLIGIARKRVAKRVTPETGKPRLNIELALFPLLVSVRQSPMITIALVGLLLLIALCRKRGDGAGMNPLPFVLLALSTVLVFRTDLGLTAVIMAVSALFVLVVGSKVPRVEALHSISVGVALYLMGNVAGQLAHIPSPLDASRLGGYETSAGFFFAERIVFPFARSINEPAVISAAYFALIAATWMTGRKIGGLHFFGFLAAAYIMVGSNSRLPLVTAILLSLAALLSPLFALRASRPLVIAAGALPFYLPLADPVIRAVSEGVAGNSLLSRGQSVQDIVGLGTRGTIWEGSVDYWNAGMVMDLGGRLFGFGVNGHDASGANNSYLRGLGGFLADRINLTMHNSFLQMLFDGGIVSLALLAVGLLVVLRRFSKDVSLLPQLVFVTVLGVGAASEIILAPGFTQTPFFLLLALAAFAPKVTAGVPRRTEPLTHRMLPVPLSR